MLGLFGRFKVFLCLGRFSSFVEFYVGYGVSVRAFVRFLGYFDMRSSSRFSVRVIVLYFIYDIFRGVFRVIYDWEI